MHNVGSEAVLIFQPLAIAAVQSDWKLLTALLLQVTSAGIESAPPTLWA